MRNASRYAMRQSAHRFGIFIGNALVMAVLVVLLFLVIDGPRFVIHLGGETWTVQKVDGDYSGDDSSSGNAAP